MALRIRGGVLFHNVFMVSAVVLSHLEHGRSPGHHTAATRDRGQASQVNEFDVLPRAIEENWRKWKGSRPGTAQETTVLPDGTKVAAGCCLPDPKNPQEVFWGNECSKNNNEGTFYYVNSLADPPRYDSARKGDIIAISCGGVYCPAPVVPNCYYSPGICDSETEFCWHQEHETSGYRSGVTSYSGYSQGPWQSYCLDVGDQMQRVNTSNGMSNGITTAMVENATEQICSGAVDIEETMWKPVQAQCVKYREEWESCIEQPLSFPNSDLNPVYSVRNSDGMLFERPLVCAPHLICTGSDYDVMPNTCVTRRAKDTCYQGTRWDSTECSRTMALTDYAMESGLGWVAGTEAIRNVFLAYAEELASPMTCLYWDSETALGKEAEEERKTLWKLFGLLWPPSETFPPQALFEIYSSKHVPSPFNCDNISTGAQCQEAAMEEGEVPNCVQKALVQARDYQYRPCKVWSVIHFYMHNLAEPVTAEVAAAARALAVYLGEKFTSPDDRSFFQRGVIGKIGLPPDSAKREDIARWYWHAHNLVSEHSASSHGTQLGDWNEINTPDGQPPSNKQNPWFMPWDTAVQQWTANWRLENFQSSYCNGTQTEESQVGLSAGYCFDYCLMTARCAGYNYYAGLTHTDSVCTLLENPFVVLTNASYTCTYVVRRDLR